MAQVAPLRMRPVVEGYGYPLGPDGHGQNGPCPTCRLINKWDDPLVYMDEGLYEKRTPHPW